MKDEIKELFELYENLTDDKNLSYIIKTLKDWYIEKEHYKDAYETTMKAYKMIDEKYNDYKQRNEKAIYKLQNIIESNNGALTNPEHSIIGKHSLLKLENDNCYILLNILKGDKDE